MSKRKRQLWARLEGLGNKIGFSSSQWAIDLEKRLRAELEEVLNQEQVLWFQKSRASFLIDGDRNTKFYHLSTVIRRTNRIECLQDDEGEWVAEKSAVQRLIVNFFANIYREDSTQAAPTDLPFPEPSSTFREAVDRNFSASEVWDALRMMGPFKAPGPDGYPTIFYQKQWSIGGTQITETVLNILNLGVLPDNLGDALVVLIPKVGGPTLPFQFRPISLLNVVFKIATKVVVNRLKHVIAELVSLAQSSFVPRR